MKKTFAQFLLEEIKSFTGEQDRSFRSSGSSDAAKFIPETSKIAHFVKSYRNVKDRENTEIAAAKFYEAVGIKTTNPELGQVTLKNGKTFSGLVSGFVNNLRKLTVQEALKYVGETSINSENLTKIALLYIVSVFIRNHDVAGLSFDNTMIDDKNEIYHVDAGGSFHYKAMGAMKGKNWNERIHKKTDKDNEFPELPDYPEELDSMMFNGKLQSAQLFFPILKKNPEILNSALDIFKTKITDESIEKIILDVWTDNAHYIDDNKNIHMSIKDADEYADDDEEGRLVPLNKLIEKLKTRRNFIINEIKNVIEKLKITTRLE